MSSNPPEDRPVRAYLLKKLCSDDEGLFALGVSIARVVQMADSDDQGTQSLAYHVLSDVALTQKILRLANTPQYRQASGAPVTTISHAISLLGFDNVKTTALAMLLVDTMANSKHAQSVRVELEAALCASLVGRELARYSPYQKAEEAAIGALFKNLGPLLIASREHDRFREINALVVAGEHSQGQASQMILGSTYDTLTATVLREWKIPDVIIRSLAPLYGSTLRPPADRTEWIRQVVHFSMDAARALTRLGGVAPDDVRLLQQRFGSSLGLEREQVTTVLTRARSSMDALLNSMQLDGAAGAPAGEPGDPYAESGEAPAAAGTLPSVLALASLDSGAKEGAYPSGKPYDAREQLLAGVQELTEMRVEGKARVNELVQAVLETLYRSMGFRFATVCLKDAKTSQFRARIALGDKRALRQEGFVFPLQGKDLFHLALENDADLMIADASVAKIRDLLPKWHLDLLPDARSFIVLPLVLQGVQLGLFYADRAQPAPEGVPPDETSLIRALKAQVLAALSP
ncbi:HD-like signal output (HDOD) domain, no enzymatic activity [Duganella sp. CF458]|uniref:HDOD domain-containing protein n=1 Tax=Duganella sp. CF458 TaxID=1884368 RepID=UPI0008F0D13E|nr:HDOD domain-containing protein [Duganella sp. CF458]SFF68266.1 HD-like signal output (HDOD) domain, no enzymatic activity [Duganella sp. CF458]